MRPKESRAGVKVWATVPPSVLARVDALVLTMPEDERERVDASRADVVRAALTGGGLDALEERARKAAGPARVKRAGMVGGKRGQR